MWKYNTNIINKHLDMSWPIKADHYFLINIFQSKLIRQ